MEFSQTDGYEEREFVIEKVTGKQKITFVFLLVLTLILAGLFLKISRNRK